MDLTLDDTMIGALEDETLLELEPEKATPETSLEKRRRLDMLREEKRLREYLNEVWFEDELEDVDL